MQALLTTVLLLLCVAAVGWLQFLQLQKLQHQSPTPPVEQIRRDAAVGALLKVRSTPTFFLNQKKIEGGLPTNLWIRIIDRTLKK